jgi:peptidoglycan/xylan/chitin deacetylase (PgdA/CDA1 family)
VLLMVGAGQGDRAGAIARRHGGEVDFSLAMDSKTRLSDFSWNHTTLWAKKSDANLTYLQVGWHMERFAEQVHAVREEYGDDFAIHGEYVRGGGSPLLASLPIVTFRGRAHLDRMVDFLEGIRVFVANPHRFRLEEGSNVQNVPDLLTARARNDPAGLLNPGKLRAAMPPEQHGVGWHKPSTLGLANRSALRDQREEHLRSIGT